jgi:N-acetylglutamate synthase-like GNAT family acetyltransferase
MKDEQRASKALRNGSSKYSSTKWTLRHYLKPGDISYLTQLHGILYAKEYGYDQTFEAYVASGLAEFIQTFQPDKDRIWLAEINDQIIGSIAIVGRSTTEAQVRWFLVHPDCRGLGLGKELLKEAILFCKECKYKNLFLWTTSELTVARHLYSSASFSKTEEKSHEIWGKMVSEERYDLHL